MACDDQRLYYNPQLLETRREGWRICSIAEYFAVSRITPQDLALVLDVSIFILRIGKNGQSPDAVVFGCLIDASLLFAFLRLALNAFIFKFDILLISINFFA